MDQEDQQVQLVKICRRCGAQLPDQARICYRCGRPFYMLNQDQLAIIKKAIYYPQVVCDHEQRCPRYRPNPVTVASHAK